MKYRVLPLVLILGLAGTPSLALADSPALQRARQAASEVDLSKHFSSRSDARSQSFGFGGTHEHPFSVKNAGRYVFTSSTLPGESVDYRITAVLLDNRGKVIARGEGLGQNGGLRLVEELEPGDYLLRVSSNKFGSETTGGNSFTIEVAGLDASDRRQSSDESGLEAGSRIRSDGPGRDGRTTAFVSNRDAVATIAAPRGSEIEGAAGAVGQAQESPAPSRSEQQQPTAQQQDQPSNTTSPSQASATSSPEQAFDEIVTDVDIRMRGEVLHFDVAKAGTVSVTSSTFVGSETRYRLEARILDASGNVVASDQAEGFEGDFDIKTYLEPGRYTVWVNGQKFGNASSGVNNYTLRIRQLDAR